MAWQGLPLVIQLAFNCSKLTIETLEQVVKYVFIVKFEHISGFDLSFGSAVVKIYPFATFRWVNKDENM